MSQTQNDDPNDVSPLLKWLGALSGYPLKDGDLPIQLAFMVSI
jgi:hypothetical protein